MFRGINSPKLPFQNQNPEKSFASPVDDTCKPLRNTFSIVNSNLIFHLPIAGT